MPTQPKVLLISSDEAESTGLEGVLREHVILTSARNLLELENNLGGSSYDAVICGWSFQTASWRTALNRIRKQYPDLPVIIFCGAGGEREWAEVLDAGGFDLLVAPYHMRSVVPLLEHAIASYEARQFHKTTYPQTQTA
jgi:DNA-binding NtrC family response regulator